MHVSQVGFHHDSVLQSSLIEKACRVNVDVAISQLKVAEGWWRNLLEDRVKVQEQEKEKEKS